MYEEFKNKHLSEKNKLESIKNKLNAEDDKIDQNKKKVSGILQQREEIGYDLNQAISERNRAHDRANEARRKYDAARSNELHWQSVCYATSWIPIVNLGTCLNYVAVRDEAEVNYDKRDWELSVAEDKVRKVRNLENQYKKWNSNLLKNYRIRSDLEGKIKCLQSTLDVQKPELQDLSILKDKIQVFKHEGGMIQARSQTVQGSM